MIELAHNLETEMNKMIRSMTAAQAIPAILQNYASSLIAGDAQRWIESWTEDCIQMPPGGPMNAGKHMLYESISAWLDAYKVSDLKPIGELEIQEAVDWAYARGQYSYRLTPQDGSPAYVFEGKFLSIFKRQTDGTWKMHRDCFNSSTPDH
jgi:ketosteroid isomerase-like protein